MAGLNPMVLEKINSMDIENDRKRLIRSLFEAQLSCGSNPKDKPYRVKNFREIIAKEMRK